MTSNDRPPSIAAVAADLANQPPRQQIPLAALGRLITHIPHDRRPAAADAVLAALCELDRAGLIVVAHRFPHPWIRVVDRGGLLAIAAAPPLDAVPPPLSE